MLSILYDLFQNKPSVALLTFSSADLILILINILIWYLVDYIFGSISRLQMVSFFLGLVRLSND